MIPEAAAEIQNQFAFISTVLGGFAVTFLIGLLSLPRERPLVTWAAGAAVAAAGFLIIAAVAGVAGAVWVAERPGLPALPETPGPLLAAFRWSGISFILGVMALLASIGLSGWTRSRVLGVFSSVVAAVTFVLLAYLRVIRMGFDSGATPSNNDGGVG